MANNNVYGILLNSGGTVLHNVIIANGYVLITDSAMINVVSRNTIEANGFDSTLREALQLGRNDYLDKKRRPSGEKATARRVLGCSQVVAGVRGPLDLGHNTELAPAGSSCLRTW